MTSEEIATIKHRMSETIRMQIEALKGKLQILRTMQSQVAASTEPEDLKKLHDQLAMMLGYAKK